MAPEEGFEPPTRRLTAACSTTELLRKDPKGTNRCRRLGRGVKRLRGRSDVAMVTAAELRLDGHVAARAGACKSHGVGAMRR